MLPALLTWMSRNRGADEVADETTTEELEAIAGRLIRREDRPHPGALDPYGRETAPYGERTRAA